MNKAKFIILAVLFVMQFVFAQKGYAGGGVTSLIVQPAGQIAMQRSIFDKINIVTKTNQFLIRHMQLDLGSVGIINFDLKNTAKSIDLLSRQS